MNQNKQLVVSSLSKSFPGVKALEDVSFDLLTGEIMGLVGENGAGKSTLVKCLIGAIKKDCGKIYLNEALYEPVDVIHSQKQGISIVYQESMLEPYLSIGENLFLGNMNQFLSSGFIMWNKLYKKANSLLSLVEIPANPKDDLSKLSAGERKLVEMARAMQYNPNILLVDEITASMNSNESTRFFKIIKKLATQGVSVIYISHMLKEVFNICNTVLILKDGCVVKKLSASSISQEEIAELMVGRKFKTGFFPTRRVPYDESNIFFQAKCLTLPGYYEDVSFDLHKGEIIGIGGIVGAGGDAIARTISGLEEEYEGDIVLQGAKINIRTPREALDAGIAYVPADREVEGLIRLLSVSFNTSLAILPKLTTKLGFLDFRLETKIVNHYIKQLRVKTPDISSLCIQLSGGNCQKIVIAKCLATNALLLVLNGPTKGIDVGAKNEIYAIILQIVEKGGSVIMISDELPELIAMSDTILIMKRGKISGFFCREDSPTEEKIIKYML